MPQFEYKLIRSRRLSSSTTISVSEKNGVIVRAPFWVPEFSIKKFLEDRSFWITTQLKKINSKKTPTKKYIEGETHLFFGSSYPLCFSTSDFPIRTQVDFQESKLCVKIFSGHSEEKKYAEIKEAMLRFYMENGIGVITEKVNTYTQKLNVSYSIIELKKVSSIWGSCSVRNNLSFNRKLVMAPHEIVDYVVIHETCHLIERNHSSRFWGLVARLDPQYKDHRRWLRDNHHLLTI